MASATRSLRAQRKTCRCAGSARKGRAPITLMDLHASIERVRPLLGWGAETFLPKPYRLDELSRVIAHLMEVRQADAHGA